MSKQVPKQKTLEFFLQKPKQTQSTTTSASKKSTSSTTAPSKVGKDDSSAKSASISAKSSSFVSKAAVQNVSGAGNASVKKHAIPAAAESHRIELSSSPPTPPAFSSSRSVASDARSTASTPPRSEVVDLDAMEEDEEEVYRPKRLKRRLSAVTLSDDEDEPSTTKKTANHNKRKSVDVSADEDETVPKAKKPNARPTKRRKTTDDDFVVPDDEESDGHSLVLELNASDEEIISAKPKKKQFKPKLKPKASEPSDNDEDEESEPKAKGSKSKPRPSISHATSSNASLGTGMLTAAERRMMDQKEEKKQDEKPFDFLVHVMDKDKKRPGEEGYNPRTLFIPQEAWKQFTAFETQFWEIKRDHYDTILFFQKGKFYELYEDDARIGHQIFDLKLTSRVKMSMVGVPESSFDFWANKFLARGYKVGKVEQSETSIGAEMRVAAGDGKAKGKELVKRVLNKVFTNGTLMDGEYLNDEEAGHCVSIREEGENKFGLTVLESSTSEFLLSSFEDDACRTRLETLLRQLRPKEIIISKGNLSISTNRLLKVVLPGTCTWTSLRSVEGLNYTTTLEELEKLYPAEEGGDDPYANLPEAIKSMITDETVIQALGSMIWYLRTLNIDSALLSAKNFNIYDPLRKGLGLVLDGQTLAHLEILVNGEGSDEGTLLKLIGRCATPFGKRLFRLWICTPLRDIKQINDRLDAVEEVMQNDTFEKDFMEVVKGIPDLERIVSRIHAGTCKVKDFLKILDSFRKLNKGLHSLAQKASQFETQSLYGLLQQAEDLSPYIANVKKMFVPPHGDSLDLVPEKGMDEEYDAISEEIEEIENKLETDLRSLAKKHNIKLEFWHSATGTKDIYIAQLATSDKSKVPKSWQKHNETKQKCRYNIPEFTTPIRKLKEARENLKTSIKSFTGRLFAAFDEYRKVWLNAVRITAELDCLVSLKKGSEAIGTPSCRPELVDRDEAFVEFEELRHPGIAMALGQKGGNDFIANDVNMGGEHERIMLLTGPNMAGKSTLMRQTCVAVIMAQLGMYVPAAKARLAPVDAILTRMGAYDSMFSHSSTFKVELDETSKILSTATPRSLVILDELGRGTSTFDGIAIAGAVLHHLATHTLALACFATHYSSLTEDYGKRVGIRCMHMATGFDDEKRELIWLYKLIEGSAPSSFGTHVASLAGVPKDVVERADKVSQDFSRQFAQRLSGKTTGRLPVSALVDLAFLARVAQGKAQLDDDKAKGKKVIKILKEVAKGYATMSA